VRGARWPIQALYPPDALDVIATAYYNYKRSFEALISVDDALAHISRQGETVTVRLAAEDQQTLDHAERRLRTELPELKGCSPHEVAVEFSYWRDVSGAVVTTRSATVPRLGDGAARVDAQRPVVAGKG